MNIKKILIAQPEQAANNPQYINLAKKYNVNIDFRPFFSIEPVSLREFRGQRINISDYTAIVFASKGAVDAFFKLCEESRFKVPDSQKYFCTTEAIALYLQKHIVYRKRKIFFGTGTMDSVAKIAKVEKHNKEKFLITSPDHTYPEWEKIFENAGLDYSSAIVARFENKDLTDLNLNDYQIIAFYNALDVRSLFANFPKYKQKDTRFIVYGAAAHSATDKAGINISMTFPSPKYPNLAAAIEDCILNPDIHVVEEEKKEVVKEAEPAKATKKAVVKKAPAKTAAKSPAKPTAKTATKTVPQKATKTTGKSTTKGSTAKNATKATKTAVKSTTTKPVAKKTAAKAPAKSTAKKPVAKKATIKTAAKKTTVKKATVKSSAKKTTAKKAAAKKAAPKKVAKKK